MTTTQTTTKLSTELLATADAVRQVRAALQQLIHEDPPSLRSLFPAVSIVSVHGLSLARAMEEIAVVLAMGVNPH